MTTSEAPPSTTDTEAPQATPPDAARGPTPRRTQRPSTWQLFHATRAARWGRLGTFLAVVCGGGSWLAYTNTTAQIGDDLLDTGDALLRFTEPRNDDGPREFSLNGETIRFASGSTERSVHEMLDWFEGVCLERDAEFTEQVRDVASRAPEGSRAAGFTGFSPVLRRERGNAGVVACLDLGTTRRTPAEILEAYRRFQVSRNLSELGHIRYLFTRGGTGGRAQFLSAWTEGEFNVDHVLPHHGDAPGEDFTSIPRAPGSHRTLSAFERGRDERYVYYQGSTMTEWELEGFYERSLADGGWTVVEDGDDEAPNGGAPEARSVLAMRDGRQLFVMLDTDATGHGSAAVMLTE